MQETVRALSTAAPARRPQPAARLAFPARRRGLLLVIAPFVAIVALHLDFVPMWDARGYWSCVEDAVRRPFDLLNFRCSGHPSIVSAGLWGLTQYVWPWKPSLLYVTNIVLGVAGIGAFEALLHRLFPDRPAAEYAMVTALFALAPLFVAHAIFLNLDYGATVFFVLFLSCLMARRFWLAGVFAAAASFSKETGAAACAAVMVTYVVAFVFEPAKSWPQRRAALRPLAPLLTMPAAIIFYLIWAAMFRHETGRWLSAYAPFQAVSKPFDAVLNTNLADSSMRAFLADIFILNYQWLYSIVLVAGVCAALIRVERLDDTPIAVPRRGIFLGLAVASVVYIVTRYRFSNGARYVLLASPVVILAFYHSLLSLFSRHLTRLVYLAMCVTLVFLSNFRTLDVVSRSFFGTFAFGSHTMLDMTSLTGGLKLDSLVYNLEFLQLQYLFGDMMRDARPRPGSVLLMGNVLYNFPPDVDGRSYALTSNPSRAVPFVVAIGDVPRSVLESHISRDGEQFFYVAFANADNVQLQNLRKEYPLAGTTRYERQGYTLDLYTFRFPFNP